MNTPSTPTCRRNACPEPATDPHGFCLAHDLRYVIWKAWRDELHQRDLQDAGIANGADPDPRTARALAAIWRYLTPGPFAGQDR